MAWTVAGHCGPIGNMDIFVLNAAPPPWGDYGNLLMHGMSAHLPPRDGHIQLERVGPFVPPVTFPASNVVVTDAVRHAIIDSGLVGATFGSVIKARVVVLHWEVWDRTTRVPPYMPPSGAPEDYVLGAPHDPATALEIGPLWELGGPTFGTGTRERVSKQPRRYRTTLTILRARSSGLLPGRGRASIVRFTRREELARKNV